MIYGLIFKKIGMFSLSNFLIQYIYKNYFVLWVFSLAGGIYLAKLKFENLSSEIKFLINIIIVILIFLFIFLIVFVFISYKLKFVDKKIPSTSKNLLFLTAVVFSVILMGITGFLINLNKSAKTNKDVFKLIVDRTQVSQKDFIFGRVSSHVKKKKNCQYFLFLIKKAKINDVLIDNLNESIYITIKSKSNENYKNILRDDFLIIKNFSVSQDVKIISYTTCIEKVVPDSILDKIYIMRQKFYICFSHLYYKSLNFNNAAFCEAVFLGNTNNLNKSIKDDFRKSGIYHILAISGLHISFFIVFLNNFLNWILKIKKELFKNTIFLFLLLLVVFLYNFIVGQKASVLRATVMAVIILLARYWNRELNKKFILCFAFIVLLLINVDYFNDSGFWLSFASVFAIIYFNDVLEKLIKLLKLKFNNEFKPNKLNKPNNIDKLRPNINIYNININIGKNKNNSKKNSRNIKIINYLKSSLISTISVNLIIFPIIAMVFNEFPLLSLPANIFAVPVFYLILFILIICSIIAIFFINFSAILIKPLDFFIDLILKISKFHEFLEKSFGFDVIRINDFKPIYIFFYYFTLFIFAAVINNIYIKRYNET